MAAYRWHEHEFIEQVAARHDCRVEHRRGASQWTMRSPEGDIPWVCVLTTAHNETDASVEWTTAVVRAGQPPFEFGLGRGDNLADGGGVLPGAGLEGAALMVAGLGVISWLRNRTKRAVAVRCDPHPMLGPGWWAHDPNRVLGSELAALLNAAPTAWRATGKEAPAFVERLSLNHDQLVVGSARWWASAAALEHHIEVGKLTTRLLRPRLS